MKGAEMFMALPWRCSGRYSWCCSRCSCWRCSWRGLAIDCGGLALGGARRVHAGAHHTCTRPQPVLAIDHHALARREPAGDQRLPLPDGGDPQWTHLDGLILANDERIRAVGSRLHDRVGHHGPAADVEAQPRVDERARPQPLIIIGEYRLQAERAGALVDLVVDQLEAAL